MARDRQGKRSETHADKDLWVVHRRLRDAGFESGERTIGPVAVNRPHDNDNGAKVLRLRVM